MLTNDPRRRAAGLAVRICAAAVSVWVGTLLFGERWRRGEAAASGAAIWLSGARTAERRGDQILVTSMRGSRFLIDVEAWCSSLSIVLCFAAVAAFVAGGDRGRRARAFAAGAGIVVVCNLIRIVATVLVGIHDGPQAIESFHDGVGTAFAVVFVLVAVAVFCAIVWPRRRVPGTVTGDRSRAVESPIVPAATVPQR